MKHSAQANNIPPMNKHPLAQRYNLKPGDIIVVPKSIAGLVEHKVVYVENRYRYSFIAENNPTNNTHFRTFDSFIEENPVIIRIERYEGDFSQYNKILKRINKCIGMRYHLTKFNCEHFVSYAWTGKFSSPQIEFVINVATFATVAFGVYYVASSLTSDNKQLSQKSVTKSRVKINARSSKGRKSFS